MFALAGMAQSTRTVKGVVLNENGEPMSGVAVKAVGFDAETITDNDGRFELKVGSFVRNVEASYENYITAKAEIEGFYIIFNMKVDKQLLKEKAKAEADAKAAEAEAKRAAEQAAAEQAKAEAEAKRAAEKAAAEKAKAEAEAVKRAAEKAAAEKAKAEAEAKRAAEKAAAEKAKAEAEAKRAAEQALIKAKISEHISGYNSIVDASLFGIQSIGVNYIGGYRFNNYLFAGAGVGVEMPLGSNCITYQGASAYVTRGVSFPVFAHVRANFLNRRWSPFFALSAGARFSTPGKISLDYCSEEFAYSLMSAFFNPQLGVNYRVTTKTSVYFSAGASGYAKDDWGFINRYQISCRQFFWCEFDLHLGVTF